MKSWEQLPPKLGLTRPSTNPHRSQKMWEIAPKMQVFSVPHWVRKIHPGWAPASAWAAPQRGPTWAQVAQCWTKLRHVGPKSGRSWAQGGGLLAEAGPKWSPCSGHVGSKRWHCANMQHVQITTLRTLFGNGSIEQLVHTNHSAAKLPRLGTFGADGFPKLSRSNSEAKRMTFWDASKVHSCIAPSVEHFTYLRRIACLTAYGPGQQRRQSKVSVRDCVSSRMCKWH